MLDASVRVSVIVPVYNGETDLPDLIECLRAQTFPSDRTEYWLVDNHSSDRTADLIKDATQHFPNLHYLSQAQIQSSYAARNEGIKAATGSILAFTDADCRPESTWLEALIKPFADPKIGIVAGEILAFPGDTLLEHYADKQETLSQKHTLNHRFCAYGQTANLAVRREAFTQVGLFRPYLTTGGDADICWRILKQTDWQITLAADAIVKHRHRRSLTELKSQWRRYGTSNRYLHELHGVALMQTLTPKDYLYRLSRWLLKEVPLTTVKATLGKAELSDIINTPLSLFTTQARQQGQKQAQLPENAREIEWMK